MDYAKKKEIVEALKRNERGLFALSKDEKEVIDNADGFIEMRCSDGSWQNSTYFKSYPKSGFVFRIKESYQLPIEPPEGYRLVTDEEIDKYEKPDCAKFFDLDEANEWQRVAYNRGKWLPECNSYAVPLYFSFEKEAKEMTVAEIEKELGYSVRVVR